MTDQPTDYHAEAEKWFGYATEDDFVDVPDMNDVIASALIGILAALLAGPAPAMRPHEHEWIDITPLDAVPGTLAICGICATRLKTAT